MTIGLTSLFSPYRAVQRGRSGRWVQLAMKEPRISRVRPGFAWLTGHARGGGEQREAVWVQKGDE